MMIQRFRYYAWKWKIHKTYFFESTVQIFNYSDIRFHGIQNVLGSTGRIFLHVFRCKNKQINEWRNLRTSLLIERTHTHNRTQFTIKLSYWNIIFAKMENKIHSARTKDLHPFIRCFSFYSKIFYSIRFGFHFCLSHVDQTVMDQRFKIGNSIWFRDVDLSVLSTNHRICCVLKPLLCIVAMECHRFYMY